MAPTIGKKLPSYLKDSTEFIKLIESTPLPPNSILASIDVTSLYTNIPHKDGTESTLYHLKNNPDNYTQPEQHLPEVLIELMDIVLINSNCYLQIQGTAMGTKMAPAYANLFMGKLEIKLKQIGNPHILIWKRFIDDIFVIWTGSKADFKMYMGNLNKVHETIKFTYELSEIELTFLDITLYKGNRFQKDRILDIHTHIKPTNKQLYTHATSYHPPTIVNAITKGTTNRYLRTNPNEFKNMTRRLANRLTQQGYKYDKIMKHISSIKFSQRKTGLIQNKTTKQNK